MDGNRKIAVELEDGITVESVFYGSGTLCLSSQAGCPLGCAFCASGRTFFRNLNLEELWAQVERVLPGYQKSREWLKEHEKELIGRL